MLKTFGLILFAIGHGYFAAWLAVWMLFYPRSPKFLFGFQLPFTPGLLPSSRGTLENAIADAVTQQLLVPQVLEESAIKQGLPKLIRGAMPEHIESLASDAEFQETLSRAVADIVKDYLRSKSGLKTEIDQTALVPFGKPVGISLDGILGGLWKQVELAVEKACSSERFRTAMKESIRKIADDLRKDASPVSIKVEQLTGKMVGHAVGVLDLRKIIVERLSSFSNEQIEELVNIAAGRHLRSIKNVAAMIGVMFGIISVLLFG